MDLEELGEIIWGNILLIFKSKESFFATAVGIFMFTIVIEPMFQISKISGILLIFTFLYILLIKTKIIIESPGYAIFLFSIFAIRFYIAPIFFDGLKNIQSGLLIEGITFIIVWLMIYIKTKELE